MSDLFDITDGAGTADWFRKKILESVKEDEDFSSKMAAAQPEVEALQKSAQANTQAFIATTNEIMQNSEGLYDKLANAERLPGGLSKIIGMFDKDYNKGYLQAKVRANAAKLQTAQTRYQTQEQLINSQADALKTRISWEGSEADNARASTSLAFQAIGSMMSVEKFARDQRIAALKVNDPKDLQKALETKNYKIGNKVYAPDEIEEARVSRTKTDQEIEQAAASLESTVLGNTKAGDELRQRAIQNMARELNIAEAQNLPKLADKDGNISFRSASGKVITVRWNVLADEVLKYHNDSKEVRQFMSDFQTGIAEIAGKIQTTQNKLKIISGVDPNNPEAPLVNGYLTGVAGLYTEKFSDLAQKQAKGLPLGTEDLAKVSPQELSNVESYIKKADEIAAKALTAAKAGKSETEKAAVDELYNYGRIRSIPLAVDVLAENALVETAFTGDLSLVGSKISDSVSQLVLDKGIQVPVGGDAIAELQAMLNRGSLTTAKKNEDLKFATIDKAVREAGYAQGLRGMVREEHTKRLLQRGAVDYVKTITQAGGKTAVSDLLNADGSWAGNVQKKAQDTSILSAVMNEIAARDVKRIAAGDITLNDAELFSFLRTLHQNMAAGTLGITSPATTADNALLRVSYGDGDPNKVLQNDIERAAEGAAALLVQQLENKNQELKDNTTMGNVSAGFEAAAGMPGAFTNRVYTGNKPVDIKSQIDDFYRKRGLIGQ